ncbi:hypothetical protein OC195_02355 [Priestia flexa]|nr:hypothetical protein OC195_02355 [Priestia flexa]
MDSQNTVVIDQSSDLPHLVNYIERLNSMFGLHAKHHKVCSRCLTFTSNNGYCPKCGHSNFRDIIITVQAGSNKNMAKPGIGYQEL